MKRVKLLLILHFFNVWCSQEDPYKIDPIQVVNMRHRILVSAHEQYEKIEAHLAGLLPCVDEFEKQYGKVAVLEIRLAFAQAEAHLARVGAEYVGAMFRLPRIQALNFLEANREFLMRADIDIEKTIEEFTKGKW